MMRMVLIDCADPPSGLRLDSASQACIEVEAYQVPRVWSCEELANNKRDPSLGALSLSLYIYIYIHYIYIYTYIYIYM